MTAEQIADRLILSSIANNIQRLSGKSLKRLTDAAGIEAEIITDEYWDHYRDRDNSSYRVRVGGPSFVEADQQFDDYEEAEHALRASILTAIATEIDAGEVTAQDLMNALMFVRAA